MPLLSIIIPVYNSEKTIGRTLESLNRMSPESKEVTEVVVVDDGSQDRSMEIIASRLKSLSPLSVVVLKQENKGTSGARNTGLQNCSGEWLFFLDADDELASDLVPIVRKSPRASALGFSVLFYKNGKPVKWLRPVPVSPSNYLDIFTAGNIFQPSNIIYKKNCIQTPFNVDFRYLEDWLFWIMNPLIFENMELFREQTSAIIHVHGGNKSANYAMAGQYREGVAHKLLLDLKEILTQKQIHNLNIQSQIGRILQGGRISAASFFLFPCNSALYAKFIVYALLRNKFSIIDVYGG